MLHFSLFQVGWFTLIGQAGGELESAAVLAAVVMAAFQAQLNQMNRQHLYQVVSIAAVGLLLDNLFVEFGLFQYRGKAWLWNAPVWVVMLWVLFAGSVRPSLLWFSSRRWLAITTGVVSGPLTYFAGVRLEAAYFTSPTWVWVGVLALLWAGLFPAMSCWAAYLERSLRSAV